MEATKVSMREFRDRFGEYSALNKAVAITKYGRTVGIYISLCPKPEAEDLVAFREASSTLHALMAVGEDDVVEDCKQLRKAGKKSRG